jgi:hypothetical protein
MPTHGSASSGTPMAAIDWDAAITALTAGSLPCSGGERRILQLAASLAAGTPASLRDTSPASTKTTPPDCSPPSGTQPENGRYHQTDRSATSLWQRPAFAATYAISVPHAEVGLPDIQ